MGLRFLFAQLRDQQALRGVCLNPSAIGALKTDGLELAIHVYVRERSEIRARVLITEGGYEDPATGSANCALAAMLTQLDAKREGNFDYHMTQGVEMGRPSTLYARACKRDGKVTTAHIVGTSVMVSEGTLEI